MQARIMTAIFLGFVLIGASACGGGGNDEAQLRTDLEAAQEELEEQRKAAEAAETEAAAAEKKRQEEEAARLAADKAKAEAEKAQAEAEKAQAEAEKAKIEAEKAKAEAEKQAKAEADRIAAEKQRADTAEQKAAEAAQQAQQAKEEQEQLQEQLTEAEQAELRARASSFGGEFGTAEAAPGMAMATVTWPRGGSLTFRPNGVTFPSGSAAPSVPGGWRSASFTGQTGTAAALVDETVYLYTNIQAPGTRAFWKVHGLTVTMDGTGLAALARGSSAAPTGPDTDANTAGRQYSELTVGGSLNGASGKFTCACQGTISADSTSGINTHVTFEQGVPTFIAPGSWTFTPSNIANGYRVNQDDAYLYFGIWSSIPDNIGPDTLYDFEYIAGGGGTPTRFAALTGSATFRGGAVGRYVTQGQVGGQNAKIGTFTATATLNADFGDGTDAGSLSGSITDFSEDGSSLAGWQVTLGSDGNVGAASDISGTGASGDTVASIGGLSVGGSWGATFYGTDNMDLADPAKYPATGYPPVDLAGVAGWFNAIGSGANDASLAGAFGAACTTGTMCAR